MMSISRKAFAAILALAIGFIVLPGVLQDSYADDATGNEAVIVETGIEYATLGEANAALAKEGQTIKLLKDIDLGTGYFLSGKGLTLDLNGHTITSSASWDYEFQRHGTVTFDSEFFRSSKIIDSSAEKNGSIINTGNGYAVFASIRDNLIIEEGNFISNADGLLCGREVIINGGRIQANRYAIDHFKANNIVTINGGVIRGGSKTFYFVYWNDDRGGWFVINGGYFSDDRGNGDRVNRKAGTKLFKVGGDGEYKNYWELRTIVAKRVSGGSETEYTDLQEAVNASSEGDQVVVMADCETDSLLVNKGITLDLNGKTVTEKGVMKANAGTLTIKDSSATEEAAGTGKIDFTKEDGDHTFDVIGNGTKLLLENGTLNAEKNTVLRMSEGAELDMTGGTVSGGKRGVSVGTNSGSIYEGKAKVSGGTVTGTEYGIYVVNGTAEVTGETTFVGSDGNSIGMVEGQTFNINGGKFSDGAGNADGFTRDGGKYLCRFDQDDVPVYMLRTAEALNETTGDYIEKLEDALDLFSENGDVIKVMKDIDLNNGALYVLHTLVLDLNGHTITSSVDGLDEDDYPKGVLCLTNKAELTINDSSEGKTGAIINNYSGNTRAGYAVWIDENTGLTIDGGTIKSNNSGIYCGETIIMNGGKIDAGGRCIYLFPFDTAVVINYGVLKSGEDDPTFYFPYQRLGPEVTINGGFFSNASGNNDDRITRKDDMLLLRVGGTGEYKDYYMLKIPVAKLVSGEEETIYADLQDAVNDAAEGDTVVVLNDCETDSLVINKALTLDLGGKTVTEKGVMKATNGSLTIKDSSATDGAEGTGRIDFTKVDENGTFEVTGSSTELVLKGGTINAPNSNAIRATGNAWITIDGGTVTGGKCGIYVGDSGSGNNTSAVIKGGTVSGTEYGIYLLNGFVSVQPESTAFVRSEGESVGVKEGQQFIIYGGTFSDAAGNKDSFTRPFAEYLVKGANETHPERYAVGLAFAKRQCNGEEILYSSLHDAVNDAEEGENTITLLIDMDTDTKTDHFEHSNKDAIIIIDLNGKKLIVDEDKGISVTNNAGIAIKNGTIEAGENVETVITATDLGCIELDEDLVVNAPDSKVHANDGGVILIQGAAVTGDLIATGEESGVAMKSGHINGNVKAGSSDAPGAALIEGGTVNGEVYKEGDASKFFIRGGLFKTDTGNSKDFIRTDNKYLADPDGDGWYELIDVDKSELEKAVSAANAAEEDIAVSKDGKDVDPAKQWTTAAEKKALDDAIAAAQKVIDSTNSAQKDIDAEVEAVKAATAAYNEAKKAGKKSDPVPEPDPGPTPAPTPTPDEDKDVDDITPSDSALAKAKTDKKLAINTKKITTSAKMKKKTMTVNWKKVKGATNYRIAYKKTGAKKWTMKWTKGKNKIVLKKMKKNGLYQFKLMAVKKSGSTWTKSKWSKLNYRFFANTAEKLKAVKKGAKVTVMIVKKGSGYDAQYALKKAAIKKGTLKTFKGAKKTKFKVKGLKAKKAYFVRTRPYKTYKGHKYIGIWNGPKKVKTK